VHERISDSYRLYLSLFYGESRSVTGPSRAESFEIHEGPPTRGARRRAGAEEKPLTIFSCCPTAPIQVERRHQPEPSGLRPLVHPGRVHFPCALGVHAPVTLVGSLVQQTAETLSGVVISHLRGPDMPCCTAVLRRSSTSATETTPDGRDRDHDAETAPTARSASTSACRRRATSLSATPSNWTPGRAGDRHGRVAGGAIGNQQHLRPGMLDFESCQSLEKLWSTTRSAA